MIRLMSLNVQGGYSGVVTGGGGGDAFEYRYQHRRIKSQMALLKADGAQTVLMCWCLRCLLSFSILNPLCPGMLDQRIGTVNGFSDLQRL